MNIYFSGIGGVGIGPLAEVALDAGYTVLGSDRSPSLMTEKLQARGIAIEFSQDGQFLETSHTDTPIDWFVYTAALSDNHPELATARRLGIKTAKRDELLSHIIAEKNLKLIAVTGTHGKTTTTGMLVWTLKQLGVPVSYIIGTTISFGESGVYDPASEYFVYECDEFDRNFLHFSPHLSLIASIDYDHPDTYPSESDYLDAFRQFGVQSDQIIAWREQHGDLFADHPDSWILDETLDITLPGAHNRRNATLVLKAVEKLGISGDALAVVEHFPGTDRRFERLADNLYSDYGHHPVEIAATLQMARELSDHVVLVYQPHQNIRQHEIRESYTPDVFADATEIYWLPTYLSREDPNLGILSPQELTEGIPDAHLIFSELDDDLWTAIQTHLDTGHLVLCMGAGTIDGWVRDRLIK